MKRFALAVVSAIVLSSCAAAVQAETLHFLIPAGPGGGLDGTARAAGQVLRGEGLIERVSYENMTGGGGGRAMSHFIETAARQHEALIINSTPLLIRAMQGLFPHSYRELTPIAALIGDYGTFLVRADAPYRTWADVIGRFKDNPRGLIVGGGSVRGSLDHIVLAMALGSARIDPRKVRYLPYDGGGKAMLALLGGEVDVLSTGFGESLTFLESGDARALAITAPQRLRTHPDVRTLVEDGVPVTITNWRGVFGPPGLSAAQTATQIDRMAQMVASPAWRATLARYGWVDLYLSGQDFTDYLEAQETQLRTTLTELGFLR